MTTILAPMMDACLATAGTAQTPIPVMMAIVVRRETSAQQLPQVQPHVLGARWCVTTTTRAHSIIVLLEIVITIMKKSFLPFHAKTGTHAPWMIIACGVIATVVESKTVTTTTVVRMTHVIVVIVWMRRIIFVATVSVAAERLRQIVVRIVPTQTPVLESVVRTQGHAGVIVAVLEQETVATMPVICAINVGTWILARTNVETLSQWAVAIVTSTVTFLGVVAMTTGNGATRFVESVKQERNEMVREILNQSVVRACLMALVFLLLCATAQADGIQGPDETRLTGLWEGTLAIEGADLKDTDRLISVELQPQGRLVVYGYNLHMLERSLEVTGTWKIKDGLFVFSWKEKGEVVSSAFEFTYVAQEERNPEQKWRLYLNDYQRGVHLHLGWRGPVPVKRWA
jgi:hypothetical protein